MDRQVGDWRVLNVGSVGLPFDDDPRASYAILDFDAQGSLSLDRRRVAYDIDKAVEHFHALDHPIAQTQEARLRTGQRNPPVPAG
jgi:diadenosine tetraphosphatase ApaH/serine/threonine PP2A family protein phosphatase